MLRQLINRSEDLKKLQNEGYSVSVNQGHLIIEDIPYVNSNKEIKTGTLISKLATSGGIARYDNQHVVYFIGEQPCFANGTEISSIKHMVISTTHMNGIISSRSFSNKPNDGYRDYYHKMVTYINILANQAKVINHSATACVFKPIVDENNSEDVFEYFDTNSSRADILVLTEVFKNHRIGIIGLGGTGSYILDFVAKTNVAEIMLFDADTFHTHNAFRSPSATNIEQLESIQSKVEYFKKQYSNMHKHIHAHNVYITEYNLDLLKGLDFVFISIDKSAIKPALFDFLEANNIEYIDVGLGLSVVKNKIRGSIRCTPVFNGNKDVRKEIPIDDDDNELYGTNIQIAELNAINASMAVMQWKRHLGFYHNFTGNSNTVYNVDTGGMVYTDVGA